MLENNFKFIWCCRIILHLNSFFRIILQFIWFDVSELFYKLFDLMFHNYFTFHLIFFRIILHFIWFFQNNFTSHLIWCWKIISHFISFFRIILHFISFNFSEWRQSKLSVRRKARSVALVLEKRSHSMYLLPPTV